jgi:plastocyanin
MNSLMRASRRSALRLAVTIALGVACPQGMALADDPQPVKVTIDNFAFTPATLTVKLGTKVTFINHDDIPHSIVSIPGKFRSKALDTDQSFEYTFATAGDFDYFCGLHPHMKGKIIVTPE